MNSLKKRAMRFIIFLGMGIVYSQVQDSNLISNPGFELGQKSWGFQVSVAEGDSGHAVLSFDDPAAAHSGTKGAKITVTKAALANWRIQLNIPWEWDAVMDQKYRLTLWGKCQGLYKSFHLAVQDGAPNYTYRRGKDFSLDTMWQQYQTEWTSDVAGKAAIRFNIFVGADTGVYYFDDFVLEAESTSGIRYHPLASDGNKLDIDHMHGIYDVLGRTMEPLNLQKRQRRVPVVITKP